MTVGIMSNCRLLVVLDGNFKWQAIILCLLWGLHTKAAWLAASNHSKFFVNGKWAT